MRIIYYSYWGTYAAYTMAALHAGIYKADSLPEEEMIFAQYELCRRYGRQAGNLIYVGLDNRLREVYSLGCRQHAGMVIRAIQNMAETFKTGDTLHFISAEAEEGRLPGLLQRLRFQNLRVDEMVNAGVNKKLFALWFRRSYGPCLKKAQQAARTVKDGIV